MATRFLEEVFIDTWGPYKYQSLSGKRFMLVIVDECSRMTWVYLMTHKSDVLNILPYWKKKVVLEFRNKLAKVRADGAPELKKAVCNFEVIYETTTADTPEQSAKAERMNKTIVTGTRSMLAGSRLPKRLWAEAMLTACFLNNLTPSVDRQKFPHEVSTGIKPSVKHLEVYRCVAYVHADKTNRDKLDLNAKKSIFIGYCRTNELFRIIDPKAGSITESSHVTLREDQKRDSILKDTNDSYLFHTENEKSEDKFNQEKSDVELIDIATKVDIPEPSDTESSQSDKKSTNIVDPDILRSST